MAVDLTRSLELLDKIAPNRPRRSPLADLDATVGQALAPTMAAAPSTSTPDAAIDRALSSPLRSGSTNDAILDRLFGDGADGGPGPGGGGASLSGAPSAPSAPSPSATGTSPTLGDVGLTGVTGHGLSPAMGNVVGLAGTVAGALSGIPGLGAITGPAAKGVGNLISQTITNPLSQTPQFSPPRASSPAPRGAGDDPDDGTAPTGSPNAGGPSSPAGLSPDGPTPEGTPPGVAGEGSPGPAGPGAPAGAPGPGPAGTGGNTPDGPDATGAPPGVSGEGSGGDGGPAGDGSLLCTWAAKTLGRTKQTEMLRASFVKSFAKGAGADWRGEFGEYQKAARALIAKLDALPPAKKRAYATQIDTAVLKPFGARIEPDEIDAVTSALARVGQSIANEVGVAIPQSALALAKPARERRVAAFEAKHGKAAI